MGLLVIVAIDHPFTGDVHVGSEPLQTVVEDFAQGEGLRAAPVAGNRTLAPDYQDDAARAIGRK